MWHECVTTAGNQEVSYPRTDQRRSLPISGATSQLRSRSAYWGFDHYRCYITNDVAPALALRHQRRCVTRLISTRPSSSFRLIRGSGPRYVAVVVPRAKLGLTKCPAVRGASEASDRNRDFAMKPFFSQHFLGCYNQPQV